MLVTDVSLAETVWTLTGRRYGIKKPEICGVLRSMIADAHLIFESKQAVWESLRDYEQARPDQGKELDITDALIVNKARHHGNVLGDPLTDFYSFDRAVGQTP